MNETCLTNSVDNMMLEKLADTQVKIADLIARRWSPRAIDSTRPLSKEILLSLLEAARWAPSCYGEQPWRYLLWDKFKDIDSWQRALSCLADENQVWAKNAPVMLLAISNLIFKNIEGMNRFAQYDTGAASENISLQASALGLVAHQMGGFNHEKIRNIFSIPDNHICMAIIAVGYPAPVSVLPKELRQRELAPRSRMPLEKFVFAGYWGSDFY